MAGGWTPEQVAAEMRRAKAERAGTEVPSGGRLLGPETKQQADYRADVWRNTARFRGRVATVGTVVFTAIAVSFFFTRNLEGAARWVYTLVLLGLMVAFLGWMTWLLVRNIIASVKDYRAVKAGSYVTCAERPEPSTPNQTTDGS